MKHFTWPIRVYYEDTDAAGVVYYANYLKFFERTRTEWLRDLKYDYQVLREQNGIIFVVRQVTVDYLKAARLDDVLVSRLQLTNIGRVSLQMQQELLREQTVICTASIKLACLHVDSLKPSPIPAPIIAAAQAQVAVSL